MSAPKLHPEHQQKHSRHSPAVQCCDQTYSWALHAKFNQHPAGNTLIITCRTCQTKHWKSTTKDWSPIE